MLAFRLTINQAESRDRPEPRTGGMGPVQSISDPGRSRNVRTQFTPDDARRFYDRFGSKQDTQGFYENPALDDLVEPRRLRACPLGPGIRLWNRLIRPQTLRDGSPGRCSLSRSGHQRDHDRTGDQEAGAVAGSCRGATGRWHSMSPCAQCLRRSLLSDLCVRPPGPAYSRHLIAEAHRVLIPGGLLCTVNLTHGTGAFSRFVSRLWTSICDRYPKLVGGCRPIHLTELLEPEGWRIRHHRTLVSFGICSEIMVAERLETV